MFLLIDKPQGITSHDVIDRLRKVTGERRIGHAGTLDPNATGLLIVGIGRDSTKKLGSIATATTKTYEAGIMLGATSDTDDAEGEITTRKDTKILSEKDIEKILADFIGEQEQVPPIFSAIKMDGKKAYELARGGKEVVMQSRRITIYSLELLSYEYPTLDVSCSVSAGTYIRSLARDIGERLGIGAYLDQLRRTQIGEYSIKDAVALNSLTGDNYKDYLIEI